MPRLRHRAFIHVGMPKTGTSYLQAVLLHQTRELRAQGLTLLPEPASLIASTHLMRAVRNRLLPGVDPEGRDTILRRLRDQSAATTGDVLITQEQLAPATPEQVAGLVRHLPGREVHLVVTTRGIARQVPSAWQERVKTRHQHTFEDFASAVEARADIARGFWRHQDLLGVADRWGATLPPQQVHVVTVPPQPADPAILLRRYCAVLAIDADRLDGSSRRSNPSLGLVQAELLRRVNVALGPRLPKPRLGYSAAVRWYFAESVLRSQSGSPAALPRTSEPWCRALGEAWISGVATRGYDVSGDLTDLLPRHDDFADVSPDVSEGAIARAAVEALATMLNDRPDRRDQPG